MMKEAMEAKLRARQMKEAIQAKKPKPAEEPQQQEDMTVDEKQQKLNQGPGGDFMKAQQQMQKNMMAEAMAKRNAKKAQDEAKSEPKPVPAPVVQKPEPVAVAPKPVPAPVVAPQPEKLKDQPKKPFFDNEDSDDDV